MAALEGIPAHPERKTSCATQSSSFIVGEYNSSFLDDAYYELAETYRRDFREFASAEAAYHRLVSEVPDSRFVDDALHFAAVLAEERGDAGQGGEGSGRPRAAAARLARARPDDEGREVITLAGVTVTLGGERVLGPLDLDLPEGAFVGLIGPPGAGKSLLLELIAGPLARRAAAPCRCSGTIRAPASIP